MYRLSYFTEEDNALVISFMKENSFAIITSHGDEHPVATHVPLDIEELDGKNFFTGHIMKNTDHHKSFIKSQNVLVIFNGPHCYVSAGWYPNPVQASTWNYMTVHAKGKITFLDETKTKKIIEAVTDKYEGTDSPAAFKNLPGEYVDRLVKAIVGFSIEVESMENVFKLSQNHEIETRKNIIEHLRRGNENESAIADEMQKRINIPKKQR